MKVTAVLCNHAEAQGNLLYVSGGGINQALVPAGAPAPWGVSLAIGLLVHVPWTATNQSHKIGIELVDADNAAVLLPTPAGKVPFAAQMEFNVGRPPSLDVGEEQVVALAVTMPGLPFDRLGRYRFILKVDGTDMEELAYTVRQEPGMVVGYGPTALPPT